MAIEVLRTILHSNYYKTSIIAVGQRERKGGEGGKGGGRIGSYKIYYALFNN